MLMLPLLHTARPVKLFHSQARLAHRNTRARRGLSKPRLRAVILSDVDAIVVVWHAVMQDLRIVPQDEVPRLPRVIVRELGRGRVGEQLRKQGGARLRALQAADIHVLAAEVEDLAAVEKVIREHRVRHVGEARSSALASKMPILRTRENARVGPACSGGGSIARGPQVDKAGLAAPARRDGLAVEHRDDILQRRLPELPVLVPVGARKVGGPFHVPSAQKLVIR